MSYERLSKRQKQLVNILMNANIAKRPRRVAIAEMMGISDFTVRTLIRDAALKYGIDSRKYIPSVRIVYLRAKELGII